MAPPQETGEFSAITTGDPDTGVIFPREEKQRPQSSETDDVGEFAVGRTFDYEHPYESIGFGD